MTADTMIKASEIRRIQHDEAMAITAVENRRLGELLIKINADQWSLPDRLHSVGRPRHRCAPHCWGRGTGVAGRVHPAGDGGTQVDDGNRRQLSR